MENHLFMLIFYCVCDGNILTIKKTGDIVDVRDYIISLIGVSRRLEI